MDWGADASNPAAVARIYEVKGRPAVPSRHSFIIGDIGQLDRWRRDVPWCHAIKLASALLAREPADACTGGERRVSPDSAHRRSAHDRIAHFPGTPVALQLLREFGGGIAGPSANRFGRISPTTAEHVRGDLGSEVEP